MPQSESEFDFESVVSRFFIDRDHDHVPNKLCQWCHPELEDDYSRFLGFKWASQSLCMSHSCLYFEALRKAGDKSSRNRLQIRTAKLSSELLTLL